MIYLGAAVLRLPIRPPAVLHVELVVGRGEVEHDLGLDLGDVELDLGGRALPLLLHRQLEPRLVVLDPRHRLPEERAQHLVRLTGIPGKWFY